MTAAVGDKIVYWRTALVKAAVLQTSFSGTLSRFEQVAVHFSPVLATGVFLRFGDLFRDSGRLG